MAVNDSVVLDDLDIWAESGHDGVCKKVVYATVKGGVLKIHFPEVKAGQALISGIAIASVEANLQPILFPASDWNWEKAGKEVMEKTPKELLPEDKNPDCLRFTFTITWVSTMNTSLPEKEW